MPNKQNYQFYIWFFGSTVQYVDFPGGSDGKASAYNAGDLGSIPGWGRFPWRRKCNPLQYSCLENPMDRGAWWATVYRVAQSRTRLSNFTFTFMVPEDSQIKLVKHPFFCLFEFLLELQLPYNVVLFSAVQQSQSAMCVHIYPFFFGFSSHLGHRRALKSESEVAQSCPTLCNPMDCSLPGSSVHEIFQARVRVWVAISFSRGSSRPRDQTQVSHIAADTLPSEPPGKLLAYYI